MPELKNLPAKPAAHNKKRHNNGNKLDPKRKGLLLNLRNRLNKAE